MKSILAAAAPTNLGRRRLRMACGSIRVMPSMLRCGAMSKRKSFKSSMGSDAGLPLRLRMPSSTGKACAIVFKMVSAAKRWLAQTGLLSKVRRSTGRSIGS